MPSASPRETEEDRRRSKVPTRWQRLGGSPSPGEPIRPTPPGRPWHPWHWLLQAAHAVALARLGLLRTTGIRLEERDAASVACTPRPRPRCWGSLRPHVLPPHGLGQRLTVLGGLRGVVAVRLDQMPYGLGLIRKLLAATGETYLLEWGGTPDLGGHWGRRHAASSTWRDGASKRNKSLGYDLWGGQVRISVVMDPLLAFALLDALQ